MSGLGLCLVLALIAPALAAASAVAGERAAPAVQLETPAANPASPWLLDRIELPRRAALAVDQPLGDPDGGRAVTLRLTPGGRRLAGRAGIGVTLGGPTEADDSSKVARPRRPTNHVTTELKLRLADEPRRTFGLGLCLAADTYATRYGRDLYVATLVAESHTPAPLVANLAYRRDEKFHGRRNQELKLGAGTAWRWPRSSRRPVDATLSAVLLLRNRRRAPIWQAGAGAFVPLADGLRLGAGVTCSTHEDRYGEGRVRGFVSLAFAR